MRDPHAASFARAEAWVRAGDSLPALSDRFRSRVLIEAVPVCQRSRAVQSRQWTATVALGLMLMLGLPGYYSSLRTAANPVAAGTSPAPVWLAWLAAPCQLALSLSGTTLNSASWPSYSAEVDEWRLVEAMLAARPETIWRPSDVADL
jgi:hypothetical protein